MLNMFLIEQYSNGKKVVLIVDEAQNLSRKVLEEIRLLSGIETHKEKVLRIILAGQPELKDTLASPSLKQLVQRVRLRFHLGPLDRREMREYIEHRLQVAGCDRENLFTDDTFETIPSLLGRRSAPDQHIVRLRAAVLICRRKRPRGSRRCDGRRSRARLAGA